MRKIPKASKEFHISFTHHKNIKKKKEYNHDGVDILVIRQTCYSKARMMEKQPRIGSFSLARASYNRESTTGDGPLQHSNIFATLYAPNTLCTSANCSKPWSE